MTETRTDQETFEIVWNGLKAQGFERSLMRGNCAYRGPNGAKCAAGHLIPDDEYSADMEGRHCLAIAGGDLFFGSNPCLVSSCQAVHDHNFTPGRVEQCLRDLATDRGLTVPE